MTGMAFGMVLAAGHLLSWNFEFACHNGRALWRGCSLCIVASVIVFASIALLARNFWSEYTLQNTRSAVLLVAAVAYVTARLMLIYLIIQSFSDLPAGVYDDIDWLQFVPFFH